MLPAAASLVARRSLASLAGRRLVSPSLFKMDGSRRSFADQQQGPDLVIEKADGLLSMRLNRPSKLNSIKQSMYGDFIATLDSAAKDPDVRMVL